MILSSALFDLIMQIKCLRLTNQFSVNNLLINLEMVRQFLYFVINSHNIWEKVLQIIS